MRRVVELVAVCLILGLAYGCVPAVVGGAAAGGYYVGKDKRSAGQIVDDAGIVVSIKTAFARDEDISVWDINVDSYDGVVTLYGKVPSRKVGRRAVKIAREVKGVDDVIDRLRVEDG